MKYWTEEAIKAHLDGTLVAVNAVTGQIVTSSVPLDHIPKHNSSHNTDFAALSQTMREVKANPWDEDEDDRLIAMRERGVKWCSIRKIMQRGERSIKERYLKLCQERGIEPLLTPSAPAPALTNEAKRDIISLRKQGCTFPQIAEMTGRPTYQVMDYYNRHMAAVRSGRAA